MLGESNRVQLAYERETTVGEIPSPFTGQITRMTSEDFKADKQTDTSKELRADRMVSDLVELGFESGGTIQGELSVAGAYDEFIESAVSGTYGNIISVSGGNIDFVAVSSDIVDANTSGAFASVAVGQWVLVSGATNAANNGWAQITLKNSDHSISVSKTLVDETGTGINVKGKMVRNGVVKHSYSLEKYFTDIGVYQVFKGQHLGKWDLSATAKQIVTTSFEFMGMGVENADTAFTTSTTPAVGGDIVSASSDMGCVLLDGVVSDTPIKEVSFTLDNALRSLDAVCSKYAVAINQGQQKVTGKFSAYFKNKTLLDKFIDHDDLALSFGFVDPQGNAMRITFPRIKLATNSPSAAGIDQDIMQDIDFTAIMDSTTGSQIQVDIA